MKNNKIFVMVPAYRDPDLAKTLDDMYRRADHPENLVVAVGAAYLDKRAIPKHKEMPDSQIKWLYWDARDRPGTMMVRHLLNNLYDGEDYYLSIDSHMGFMPGWDTRIINELNHLAEVTGKDKVIMINHTFTNHFKVVQDKLPFFHIEGYNAYVPRREIGDKKQFGRGKFLYAGLFFTFGKYATDVGWTGYAQMESEEPYISMVSYMKGWDIYHLLGFENYMHSPEKYYKVVRKPPYIGWREQERGVPVEMMNAFLFNDYSRFAVENPERTNEDWWKFIGLENLHKIYSDMFRKKVLNNIDEAIDFYYADK